MINVACYTNDKCDQPATVDRGSKVSETPDPINSTGAPQPTSERGAIPSPQRCQHQDIQLDLQKVFLQFAILHPEGEWISDILCVQVVQ